MRFITDIPEPDEPTTGEPGYRPTDDEVERAIQPMSLDELDELFAELFPISDPTDDLPF